MVASIWDVVHLHLMDGLALSGAEAQAPWYGVLETMWLHCGEAQQVGCPLHRKCQNWDCNVHTQWWKACWAACGPRVWHSYCRDILECWGDYRLKFPGLSDLAGNTFCVIAASAANERVFSVDDPVVSSRRVIYKSSSVNDILLFNSVLRKKHWSLTRFHIFIFQRFTRPSVGFEMNHWINCH